jgi:hypothetical protein
MRVVIPLAVSVALLLSGCGDTRLERAGTGAVAGAATGAAAGALCCGHPLQDAGEGAVIGAAVGAIIGVVIDHPLFFRFD